MPGPLFLGIIQGEVDSCRGLGDEADRRSDRAERNCRFHPNRLRDRRETDTGREGAPGRGGSDYGEWPGGVLSIPLPAGHNPLGGGRGVHRGER